MKDGAKPMIMSISSGTIVKTLLFILLGFVLFYLRDVLLIFLTAVVLASAIEPGTQWFVRRGLPRIASVAIIYLFIIALIAAIFYFILPTLIKDLTGFANTLPKYISALDVRTKGFSNNLFGLDTTPNESVGDATQNLITNFSTASGSILGTLTAIFGGATSFIIIVVLSFYLAVQERGIEEFLRIVIPIRHEQYATSLWRRTQHKIGRWMQGQILLAVFIGILVFIGLSILRVEHAFFLAIISAVFEIIPVFGPIIGAVPGVAVAFMQGGLTFGVIVAVMYLIVQQIENHVIYPLVVKKVINIPPLFVIVALIVGAKLGGFLGILLSVPVATALTEFLKDLARDRVALRAKISGDNV
jgi:predicted PurR-regulated permease PerM